MKRKCVYTALFLLLGMPIASLWAANYSVLHNFGTSKNDGFSPFSPPLVINSRLYGTTWKGGDKDLGVIYSLNTKNGQYKTLHEFDGGDGDGAQSQSGLYYYNMLLYGMTASGGQHNAGTAFTIKRSGSQFNVIHHFGSVANDGSGPIGNLVAVSEQLYGVTTTGGTYGNGTIFRMNPDGSSYSVIHHFAGNTSDGGRPMSGLTRYNNKLYGTTIMGGSSSMQGLVFSINPDGTGYTILHRFSNSNSDGGQPWCQLLAYNDILYGVTMRGGSYGNGVLFAIKTDGTAYKNIHSFGQTIDKGTLATGAIVTDGKYIYGTTQLGGLSVNDGLLYAVDITSDNFIILHDFGSQPQDGTSPYNGIILYMNVLYGCTYKGGSAPPGQDGTLFSFNTTSIHDEPFKHIAYTRENTTADADYSAIEIDITGDDPDSDPAKLVYSHMQPLNGTVTHNVDQGTFTYKPAFNFSGTDSFMYMNYFGQYGTVTIYVRPVAKRSDFDGDGIADVAVYAPQSGDWYVLMSHAMESYIQNWGWSETRTAPADYDGDGAIDLGVYWPEEQQWFILESKSGQADMPRWGNPDEPNSIPVCADYDNDSHADLALYDPDSGQWYVQHSTTDLPWTFTLGGNGDYAQAADYDGDTDVDPAVYVPASNQWEFHINNAVSSFTLSVGTANDLPVAADYDGDGTTDPAIYTPATGIWTIHYSQSDTTQTHNWGWSETTPVPADYDGDGKDDLAVYHQATGNWYIQNSSNHQCRCINWGWNQAVPACF